MRKAAELEETVKWGHLVYAANGPVLLIRAEDERVLFGFWRGRRLREIEPRLKPGGKYEMATLELREGMTIKPAVAARLAREAVALNRTLGDPTKVVKKGRGAGQGRAQSAGRRGRLARSPEPRLEPKAFTRVSDALWRKPGASSRLATVFAPLDPGLRLTAVGLC